jgi:hypothetical protein
MKKLILFFFMSLSLLSFSAVAAEESHMFYSITASAVTDVQLGEPVEINDSLTVPMELSLTADHNNNNFLAQKKTITETEQTVDFQLLIRNGSLQSLRHLKASYIWTIDTYEYRRKIKGQTFNDIPFILNLGDYTVKANVTRTLVYKDTFAGRLPTYSEEITKLEITRKNN